MAVLRAWSEAESSSSRNSVLMIRSVQNGGVQVENDILLVWYNDSGDKSIKFQWEPLVATDFAKHFWKHFQISIIMGLEVLKVSVNK